MDLPITFEIPFFVAASLLAMTICLLLPFIIGKDTFRCEADSKAIVWDDKLPYSGWSCFIQGSVIYITLITIFTYFALLSFSVWRYLHSPLNPLFKIHKKYYHLVVWIYVLGLYIALVIDIPNDSMGTNPVLGICGAHLFTKPEAYIFTWFPLLTPLIIFALCTPATIYKLVKHLKDPASNKNEHFNKEVMHLSIRLVLYTFFLSGACCCFLYVQGEAIFNKETWDRIAAEWGECLLTENLKIEYGLDGDLDSCTIDPNAELPVSVYFMKGVLVFLLSIGGFTLSCSGRRYAQWKNIASSSQITLRSRMASVTIGSRKASAHTSNMGSATKEMSISSPSSPSQTGTNDKSQSKKKKKRISNNEKNLMKYQMGNDIVEIPTTPPLRSDGMSASSINHVPSMVPTTSLSAASSETDNQEIELV